jgi:hypothetical protein
LRTAANGPLRLEQIFTNLLNNAAKHTPLEGHIETTAKRDAEDVLISVRDTGIGIAPDVLPRVFDLFVQTNSPVGLERGGLGVGLALVRTLVEMRGGEVQGRSDGVGRGSEFVVRLPLAHARMRQNPGDVVRPEGVAAFAPLRVMVVGAQRDAANILVARLERAGAIAAAAYSGSDAIEMAEALILISSVSISDWPR